MLANIPATQTVIEIKAPGGPEVLVPATRPVPEPKPAEPKVKKSPQPPAPGSDEIISEAWAPTWDGLARSSAGRFPNETRGTSNGKGASDNGYSLRGVATGSTDDDLQAGK